LFSPKKAAPEFYDNAIKTYLDKIMFTKSYKILRKEKGVIPLGIFEKRNPLYDGIGGNGGAKAVKWLCIQLYSKTNR